VLHIFFLNYNTFFLLRKFDFLGCWPILKKKWAKSCDKLFIPIQGLHKIIISKCKVSGVFMENEKIEGEGLSRASFQCMDAIEISLFIEKEGLFFYESAGKKIQNPQVREMFSRLADEEREHIQALQEKSRYLQPAIAGGNRPKEHLVRFIDGELKGKIFPAMNTSSAQEIDSDKQALELGIESEKRSIEMLQSLLEKEKKLDVKAIFSHLLVEEKKHLLMLQDLKTKL
jgi:rubrerythrin